MKKRPNPVIDFVIDLLSRACRQNGHSLLEIIFVISIMTIIAFAGIPNIKKIMIKTDQEIALDRLRNAIQFAKNEAFNQNKMLTLCPSQNQSSCSYADTWDSGFILFENPKKENQPREGSLLQVFAGARYGKILFKASAEYLSILPNGSTTQYGHFVYCPKEKGIEPKGLILNSVARVYPAEENPEEWNKIKSHCGPWFLSN